MTDATWGRFWHHVEKTSTCWLWTGGKTERGYGLFTAAGKKYRAHRFAYEKTHGPVPTGLVLDHLCRVRHCVNPAHLEAVTQRTNTLRGENHVAKGAVQTHCKHGHLLDAANVSLSREGHRRCRACWARTSAAYKQERRQREGSWKWNNKSRYAPQTEGANG